MKFLLTIVLVFATESGPLYIPSDFAYFSDRELCEEVREAMQERIAQTVGLADVRTACVEKNDD